MRLVQLKDGEKMAKALKNKIIKSNKENKYIFDFIIDDIKNNCLKNTFIYNEGGIGKTTQLKKLVQMLLSPESRKYASNIIPVYIAVKDLHGSKKVNILFNSIKKFCGKDSSDEELENLLDGSSSLREDAIFLFIIDGLNEAKDEIKRELQREINDLMKFKQNIFIVSSRIDETNIFLGFEKKLFVKPLSNVCEILNIQENEINQKLLEILSIPLYLKYYLNTYTDENYKLYKNKSVKKSDILFKYINHIKKNLVKNTVSYDPDVMNFIIEYFLPALAFELSVVDDIDNILDLIENKEYYRKFGIRTKKAEKYLETDLFETVVNTFALFDENTNSFVHDIWKEYLTAAYYSKCIDNDIFKVFDNLPSEEIREFIGEITGECDFENVTELEEAKKSPLNQFLQRHNLQQSLDKQLSDTQTRNIIEIMKTSRNNSVCGDYSFLNLEIADFVMCDLPNSKFKNSILSDENFIRAGCIGFVSSIKILEEDYFICLDGEKTNVVAYNYKTHKQLKIVFDFFISDSYWLVDVLDNKKMIVIITTELEDNSNDFRENHCLNIFSYCIEKNVLNLKFEKKYDVDENYAGFQQTVVINDDLKAVNGVNDIIIFDDFEKKFFYVKDISRKFLHPCYEGFIRISSNNELFYMEGGNLFVLSPKLEKIVLFNDSNISLKNFYISSNGAFAAVLVCDGPCDTIYVYDIENKNIILKKSHEFISDCSLSYDGNILIYTALEGTVYVWNVKTDFLISKVAGSNVIISNLKKQQLNSAIAFDTYNGMKTYIWDFSVCKLKKQIDNNFKYGTLIGISNYDDIIVYNKWPFSLNILNGRDEIINVSPFENLFHCNDTWHDFSINAGYSIQSVTISSNNKILIIVSCRNGIFLYNTEKKELICHIAEEKFDEFNVVLNEKYLIFSKCGNLHIYDIETESPRIIQHVPHNGFISAMQLVSKENCLYCYDKTKEEILKYCFISKKLESICKLKNHMKAKDFFVNKNNDFIFICQSNDKILLKNCNNQILLQYIPIQSNILNCDFKFSSYYGTENSKVEFFACLYENGATIPDKYNPMRLFDFYEK